MVLGRVSELNYLNTYYEREGSRIMVVYGEKNIGKTTLLNEFVKDKPGCYYRARSASDREQRYQWGREFKLQYPSYTEIFHAIMQREVGKRVLIIDEFQYIVKASDTFMQELITFVKEGWTDADVMVILCSSSIGWVENSMITRIGKAAYSLSGFLKIKELDFDTMMKYFPGFPIEKCIEAYAVLGGVPGLWRHFNDKLSIKENICNSILNDKMLLFAEGQRIVADELRETGVYNTILASIAAGNQKLNDLYLHTEFSRAKISVYLKNLMELELVEKVFSYDTDGKANVQKGIYRIKNHFVHFYFKFLYPNLGRLEHMDVSDFYDEYIEPYFRTYVEKYYKKVCTQYMEWQNKQEKLPVLVEKFGEWVGKLGNIDIIAQGQNGETVISLCNWEKPLMRYDDYEWLLFCAQKAKIRVDFVYLFSASRFDEKLILEARMKHNLKLVTLDEM